MDCVVDVDDVEDVVVCVGGCQQQREGTHILYRLALSTRMLRNSSNKSSIKG